MSLRDGPFGDIRVPLTWSAAAALVIAIIIAGALLLGDRRETMKTEAYDTARHAVDAVAAPVGGTLSAPVRWTHSGLDAVRGYFFAVSENRKLKAELAAAQTWRDRMEALQVENDRYRALLGVRTDPPLPHVFARTVLDARGPFANTRLADVGSAQGVVEGNPVLSERGVVGRIVGVSQDVSRIMLLTDVESRTPILVVRTNGRAILSGDGGPGPKLDYIRGAPLKEGDRVMTSGDGGVYPRGLPVGTVVKGFDGGWRVALDSDASPIDDVQILLFKDFSQLVDARALAPKELPTAMTEEPSQSIVGRAPAATTATSAGAAPPSSTTGAAAAQAQRTGAHGPVPAKPRAAGAADSRMAGAEHAAKPSKPAEHPAAASSHPLAAPGKPAGAHHAADGPAKPTGAHGAAGPGKSAEGRAAANADRPAGAHVTANPAKPAGAHAAAKPAKPAKPAETHATAGPAKPRDPGLAAAMALMADDGPAPARPARRAAAAHEAKSAKPKEGAPVVHRARPAGPDAAP